MKLAICQVADTGPLESLALMLGAAGYECALPDRRLRDTLQRIGCDTVLSPDDLVASMGYDVPNLGGRQFREVGLDAIKHADLYVDIKAHRTYNTVVKQWPNLKDKVLWYRINGGKPEHVIRNDGFDCGDEANPPCPVLTPNQWYDAPRAYTCWPPFYRFHEYPPRSYLRYDSPVCLVHNLEGWGYGKLAKALRSTVRMYGRGSPDGLIPHSSLKPILATTLAMVHLKSSDAPGYAIYEAAAARCPLVCTRRLIWRCKMQDLLEPGVTCLVFDRETHDGLTDGDVVGCASEVALHLARLRDPVENQKFGDALHDRLLALMWDERRDGNSFRQWMELMYG